MRKSIRLTTIFSCVVAFFASLILSISFSIMPAKAETSPVFQMESGASIKLSGNGLRFKAKMSQDYYDMLVTNDSGDDVLLYGYIAPIEIIDGMTEYSVFIGGGKRVGGELDQDKIYQGEDGYYYANIVMTNLDTHGYQDDSFSAIIFIEDNSGSSPIYIYPELALDEDKHINIEAQNRTQYDIVNAAFLDGEESYESKLIETYGSWYGTEDYPIFINTQAEYDAFVSKLEDTDFKAEIENNKHVFVKEGLGDIESVVSVTKTSGHTVRFWDGNKLLDTCYVEDGALVASPEDPTRDGYEVSHWVCNGQRWDFAYHTVEDDLDLCVQWKIAKSQKKDTGNLTVYGVTRADGTDITEDTHVIGQKVVLASGSLADGAYYPGETNGNPDPTDENNSADQAYIAYDGQYGFNDYFVADFTGKNMPTMAFFANNYNESIFYGDGTKNGVVVATGLTWPNGLLFTEPTAYCTSVFNGKGLCMWGPHMIYSTSKNAEPNSNGVLLHPNVDNVALGRENLVSGKHYRVIMGFQPGDDPSNMAIKLVYVLYDLDNDCIVESKEMNTYNFFADGWAKEGKTRDEFCLGSIVAYGYFATPTVLDKTYAIYEDTTVEAISLAFGMSTQSNTTANGDSIVLGASGIGDGANYIIGQNNGGYVNQSYYALNGDYNLDDYVAFDFTGKNMPEIAFFAKNYNNSMYAEGTSKQGIVVVTGITTWDGQLGSGVNGDGTQINYGFPYMIQNTGDGAFVNGSFANSALGRANLVDGKHYRVIMGFTGSGSAITLNWCLYDLDTDTVVEQSSMSSWGFFDGKNDKVGNMTLNDLSGSIVLYGKFGVACTIDKLYGVYEDTNISKIMQSFVMRPKTVTFKNYDGTLLQEEVVASGVMPEYKGETPYRPGDAVFSSYEFVGWDKELSAVTDDVTYTAVFTGTAREDVTFSGDSAHTYGVEQSNNKIVLKASGIGDGANYTLGQNNGGYVHQSYLALNGKYGLNDYVAFDFTGKNLPEIAFFANNYDDSMYAGTNASGNQKTGIVVVTGITTWDGQLGSGVNNNGTQINYGFPYMIQDATSGGFCQGAFASSALGRANLIDDTPYRVIMGFTGSGSAITLNWYLYNLDTNTVVEQSSMTTWNFFTGSNAQVGNMTTNDLLGSIVLYGKFGVACTLDKVHGVFEDTDIATIASGLNEGTTYSVTFKDADGNVLQEETLAYGVMPEYKGETPVKASDRLFDYTFTSWDKPIVCVAGKVTYTATFEATDKEGVTTYNTTNAGSIVLGAGGIGGDGASIETGAGNGYVDQAYLALDGSYALNDYVAFDFTGKNMPEIAFFAKNYNNSMYAEGTSKQGIVVVTGITAWDGTTSWVNGNSTQINYGFPYMIQNTGDGGFVNGAFANSALGRASLVDNTHYRVIMGFTGSDSTITLNWYLYNLDTKAVVEQGTMTTWGFFSGSNAQVGNMTINDLSGSIVLYGKFGTTCTIDKLYEVFEDTTLEGVIESIIVTEGEGSGEGEPSEPTSKAPDYSKYTDQFDFYAYSCYSDGTYEINGEKYYIGKNLANLKQYAMYHDVGMTIYFPQNDMLINGTAESIANAKALIDDLAKVGIHKTILQDNRILNLSMTEKAIVGSGLQFADNDALDAYIYDCVKDYANYPGVYGVQLGDEPKYACLSAYAAVYNSLKRVNAKYGFNLFIQYNLNPLNVTQDVYDNYYPATSGTYEWEHWRYTLGWNDRFTDAVKRYTQYINDFLDAMNPDSIMYDDYPIREDKNGNKIILDSYIPCLQIVSKAATDRGIKFYHITQAFDNNANGKGECRREVTEAGAKWLNNILMGFGAKQLAYYTYYTRAESDSTGGESFADGASFVDYNGNPTALYGWMQVILANNQKFAPTILQFDYKGSKTYGSADHLAEVTVSNSFAKLSSFAVSTGAALVTELYDDENNNYMYMAMNVLDPDADVTEEEVTMTFNGYNHVLVYVDGVATKVAITNGVYTATLTNGEAVYVIPYNE
ncbi:MAG: hypothetical protein J6A87_03160 [Clostridia bacterium]|nr:hypothetical protein [Clostridia bacterium]